MEEIKIDLSSLKVQCGIVDELLDGRESELEGLVEFLDTLIIILEENKDLKDTIDISFKIIY